MARKKIEIGDVFTRWTVVGGPIRSARRELRFPCRCECGKERTVLGRNLANGLSESCGCIARTHGFTSQYVKRPEYTAWQHMRARCTNPSHPMWGRYGGRGISVCREWMGSFEAFIADMGPRPSPKHSIDRIDNDGNYEPGNCRWATPREQLLNRSCNVLLTHDGRTQALSEWVRETGICRQLIDQRLRYGWTHSEALTIKPNRSNRAWNFRRPRTVQARINLASSSH